MSKNGREGVGVNGVPSLTEASLPQAIKKMLDEGRDADLILLVGALGEEGREIRAHKFMLKARSEVFATVLESRWNKSTNLEQVQGEGHGDVNATKIDLRPMNPVAFECFMKYIYSDDLEDSLKALDFEDLLDFSSIAEMYGFTQLCENVNIKIAQDLVNDSTHSQSLTALGHKLDENLRNLAFALLKRDLNTALDCDNLVTTWTKEIWEDVLRDESISVKEINLFQNLWRWTQHELSTRDEVFQKLSKLIRFPTMTVEELFTEVRPTGALSDKLLMDILQHKHGIMTPSLPFPFEQRTNKFVYDVTHSTELDQILDYLMDQERIEENTEILLLPGVYCSDLEITENLQHLTLTGFGPFTIFKGSGHIKISSNDTHLKNVTLAGSIVIKVMGSWNSVQNIRVITGSYATFDLGVHGENNRIQNIRFQTTQIASLENIGSYAKSRIVKPSDKPRRNDANACQLFEDRERFLTFLISKFGGFVCEGVTHPQRVIWNVGAGNSFMNFEFDADLQNQSVPIEVQGGQGCGQDRNRTAFLNFENSNKGVFENVNWFPEGLGGVNSLFQGPPKGSIVNFWSQSSEIHLSKCCFKSLICTGIQHTFDNVIGIVANISEEGHVFEGCKFGKFVDESGDYQSPCENGFITIPEWLSNYSESDAYMV